MNLQAAIALGQLIQSVGDTKTVHGLPVTVEVPKGQVRELKNDDGAVVYRKRMHNSYGYISNTRGRDGDDVDCFLGPLGDRAKEVYIVHMRDLGPDVEEREDEDKVFLGFPSADAAKMSFLLHYPKSFFGGMTSLSVDDFKEKLATSQLPYHEKKLHADTAVKCPRCGSTKYGLMPTDFETKKCSKCGKLY